MNSNLHCFATNCAFNKTGGCYASQIKVEGFDAAVTPETYCDTFRDKDNYNFTNSSDNLSLTNTQNISCSANTCTYNVYGACNASHVEINFKNSSCETFVIK